MKQRENISDSSTEDSRQLEPKEGDSLKSFSTLCGSEEQQQSPRVKYGPSYMNCIAVGHPFLTYNIKVRKEFLISLNEALQLFERKHVNAGGETLNIARVAQWMLKKPKSIVFVGSRAMDDDSQKLIRLCQETKLSFRMQEVKSAKTSVHLILHHSKRRCELYFYDPQTAPFSSSYFDKPNVTQILERANIFFTSDLCLAINSKSVHKLAYFCCSRFKLFCLSLFHAMLAKKNKDSIFKIIPFIDVLFISLECAQALIKVYNIPACHSYKQKARAISAWIKAHSMKTCTVIMHDGLQNAYVHTDLDRGLTAHFHSKYFKPNDVQDFFGTNYAFVGGFIAMMIQGAPIETSIDSAFFAASLVSKKFGLYFDDKDMAQLNAWKESSHGTPDSTDDGRRRRPITMPFTIFHSPWKFPDARDKDSLHDDMFTLP